MDVGQAAIPEPGEAATADLSDIMLDKDRICLSES